MTAMPTRVEIIIRSLKVFATSVESKATDKMNVKNGKMKGRKLAITVGRKVTPAGTADPIQTTKTIIAAAHGEMVPAAVPTVLGPTITNHHLPTLNAA